MAEVTLKDIARLAGVSAATVDRVLHGRGNSRPDTVARIGKAIDELGYRPNLAASRLARGRSWRIGVMLPDAKVAFLEGLASALPALSADFRNMEVEVELIRVPNAGPVAYADELERFAGNLDACAFLGPKDPAVAEAVRKLEGAGVRMATLISDIPTAPRTLFAGPDNEAMGATAAELASVLLAHTGGAAAVIRPHTAQEDHDARLIGFRRALSSAGIDDDRICKISVPETEDVSALSDIIAQGCRGAKVDAIYLTGGPTSRIVGALEQLELGNPMKIGTDLTPTTREFLIARRLNAVVASDAVGEMRDAITGLARKLAEPLWRPESSTRPIQVFNRHNVSTM